MGLLSVEAPETALLLYEEKHIDMGTDTSTMPPIQALKVPAVASIKIGGR